MAQSLWEVTALTRSQYICIYTFMADSIGFTFKGSNANTLGADFALDIQSSLEDKNEVGAQIIPNAVQEWPGIGKLSIHVSYSQHVKGGD